jgi:hypothetical protein
MKNSPYSRRSDTVSTEKVAGHDAGGLPAKELTPGRRGPP